MTFYRDRLGFECGVYGDPPDFVVASRDEATLLFAPELYGSFRTGRSSTRSGMRTSAWTMQMRSMPKCKRAVPRSTTRSMTHRTGSASLVFKTRTATTSPSASRFAIPPKPARAIPLCSRTAPRSRRSCGRRVYRSTSGGSAKGSKSRVASVRFRERRRPAGAGLPLRQVTTVASWVADVASAVLIGVASGVPQGDLGREVGLEGPEQVVRSHVVGSARM